MKAAKTEARKAEAVEGKVSMEAVMGEKDRARIKAGWA